VVYKKCVQQVCTDRARPNRFEAAMWFAEHNFINKFERLAANYSG